MSAIVEPTSSSHDALPVCLWQENPYRLVSLWDMEKFAGNELHAAITCLEITRCTWEHAKPPGDELAARLFGQERMLTPTERDYEEKQLDRAEKIIRNSGLPTSAEAVGEFRSSLSAYKERATSVISAANVVSRIDEISRTMMREMKSILFLYVSAESAKKYREPLQDWDEVVKRWPRIALDIEEASKCFALDRFAGAIFHILLVAEFGVIQVCNLRSVSGNKPGWGCVQRLEGILKRKHQDRSPSEQRHSQLLTDIVPMIVAVKDSTRHKISHVDNKLEWLQTDFGPQIASEVISATRGFMRRLAKELPVVP